jgi:hypothetical protein
VTPDVVDAKAMKIDLLQDYNMVVFILPYPEHLSNKGSIKAALFMLTTHLSYIQLTDDSAPVSLHQRTNK